MFVDSARRESLSRVRDTTLILIAFLENNGVE